MTSEDPIILAAIVPDEPPDGSVVLDREHRAWQRSGGAWGPCQKPYEMDGVRHSLGWPWAHLLVEMGPLTLMRPEIR